MNQFLNKLIVYLVLLSGCILGKAMRIEKSAYHEIVVDIRTTVPAAICNVVLENLEITLRAASQFLYSSLDGRVFFGSVIVNLPEEWPDSCVPNNGTPPVPSNGGKSDFTITTTNFLYGDKIWTQQSGGCGASGDQIYIPYRALEGKNVGKEFVKEWAKYRYGIFDEIGFYDDKIYPQCYFSDSMKITGCSDNFIKDVGLCTNPNPYADMVKTINKTARTSLMYVPQAEGVTMFCDEGTHDRYAPTKHNLMCDRKSTLEVILRHKDFTPSNLVTVRSASITNTVPLFHYRRRQLTRYVVVIDETQEILLRESWSFLRSAIRKWVVYDLRPNTEIGIVLAAGSPKNKILPITKLDVQKNRDLVASFVPYAPSDSRHPACISCALKTALDMLEERSLKQGNGSHVIVVLAPGMDYATIYQDLVENAIAVATRIVTINFPSFARRLPLDKLASLTGGMPFTIQEKKYNSEKSYLDTYFELAEALFIVSQEYYEGPSYRKTVEIHRKELVDVARDFITQTKRASRVIQGTFFMDGSMSNPSGFFVYTHNAEMPLIQNIRLTSPTGVIYNTRSDQRMPVKQLTVLANINETGAWAYMIERFNGNPQPHFVQVMATPNNEKVNTVRARTWVRALQAGGPFIFYCEVKRGDYPVHSAHVKVTITRPDIPCNYTVCEDTYKLLDTGAGDPDITRGDGIYSRYINVNTGPGTYKFQIYVDDNGNTAYSLHENAAIQNIPCCGSSVSTKQTRQTVPFQRYLPPMTYHITQEDIDAKTNVSVGRIGDLIITFMGEGRLRLTWTTPDMGGESVARYEIKFAFTIEDIIDRYETAAIMWNHNTPYPYDVGDICTFTLDINFEPRLFGQAVFFAIRPYAKLATNAIGGPISNAVRSYIPNKIELTTEMANSSGFPTDFNASDIETDDDHTNTFNKSLIAINVMYSIPIIIGTLFVFCLIGICYLRSWRYRRRQRNERLRQRKAARQGRCSNEVQEQSNPTSILNQNSVDSTPSQRNTSTESPTHSSTNETISLHSKMTKSASNYATSEMPDHHTVGIPVYKNLEDLQNKRLSTSTTLNVQASQIVAQHDFVIDELKAQSIELNSAPMPGFYTRNCSLGGLSIISTQSDNATISRSGRPQHLPPFESSWTASQLLYEHERCASPLEENINRANLKHGSVDDMFLNGSMPPPVPPLPYSPNLYQYQYPFTYSTMPKEQLNDQTIKTNYSTIAYPPTEQSFNDIHQSMLVTKNSCKGNINLAGDKRRRNVTMV